MDTDASRRIHYTALFRCFEAAEIEFFRSVGVLHTHPGISFPRVHVECDYRGAIRYDDLLVIEVSVGHLGSASIHFKFRVLKDEAETEAASGKVVIACMNDQTERAVAIPAGIREKLRPHVIP
jgi:YbgC/YbaW family acyl-CoA thioester hydrolase